MSGKENETETICPKNRQEWRKWLQENHSSARSVWLIYRKKSSGIPTISHSDAVDEALCFGWIDSIRKSLDSESFVQFFGRRKPKSVWSKINKEKVEQLIDADLMMPAGFKSIEIAKQNGSWTILNEVEELVIPQSLEKEFNRNPGSKDFFLSLSKSVRKAMLQWLVLAKQQETEQKRSKEIAELAAQKLKPKQFR